MRARIELTTGHQWAVEFDRPLSISIRLRRTTSNLRAYFLPPAEIAPAISGTFIGSIADGGSVNCDRLVLYPHGNGTHTECVGHISHQQYWIADCVRAVAALALLVSIEPTTRDHDRVICADQLRDLLTEPDARMLIIRTRPNDADKCQRDWSGTNPPYLEPDAARLLRERNIVHLAIDLPSIDPESDGGALLAHRAFWNYPDAPRLEATITELCYIPDDIPDGTYWAQIGILPLESDASPSQVVLYPATKVRA